MEPRELVTDQSSAHCLAQSFDLWRISAYNILKQIPIKSSAEVLYLSLQPRVKNIEKTWGLKDWFDCSCSLNILQTQQINFNFQRWKRSFALVCYQGGKILVHKICIFQSLAIICSILLHCSSSGRFLALFHVNMSRGPCFVLIVHVSEAVDFTPFTANSSLTRIQKRKASWYICLWYSWCYLVLTD